MEDLKHLLFECPAYGGIRARWPRVLPQVLGPSLRSEALTERGGPSRCPRGFDMPPRHVASPDDCPATVLNQQDQTALAYALSQVLAHRNRVLNMC